MFCLIDTNKNRNNENCCKCSYILLEKKCKDFSLGYKLSAPLTAEQTQKIIDGDTAFLSESGESLLRDLGEQMRHGLYAARTIVEYSRIPYIYAAGNVRVTLDFDIRTGLWSKDFLDWDSVTVPASDVCLLEVKYDNFIPDVIRDADVGDDVHFFHGDLAGLGLSAQNLALLALVTAGQDNDGIVFTNLHSGSLLKSLREPGTGSS